jgi:hypothetical protein
MAIWNILQTFGIFYDHLVHFVFIWYIFSGFGIMYQEKSGNPAPNLREKLEKFAGSHAPSTQNLHINDIHLQQPRNAKD